MRRLLLTMAMMMATAVMTAQNVQLHYDFGHTIDGELSGRPNVTTTVEMFKPDALGSTFMFTDIDYYADGAAGAYWKSPASSTSQRISSGQHTWNIMAVLLLWNIPPSRLESNMHSLQVWHGTGTVPTFPRHSHCRLCSSSISRDSTAMDSPDSKPRPFGGTPSPMDFALSLDS